MSTPEEVLSESGISEREDGRLLEVDVLGCANWLYNAEIELDIDLVREEDAICIGLNLKL